MTELPAAASRMLTGARRIDGAAGSVPARRLSKHGAKPLYHSWLATNEWFCPTT